MRLIEWLGETLLGCASRAHWFLIIVASNVCFASTYTVVNTNDSGFGSLRQAILDANANPGNDEIHFSIGTGLQTISPISALPTILDPLTIDGYTQPGSHPNTQPIEQPDDAIINIELFGKAGHVDGLTIGDDTNSESLTSGTLIRGLSIGNFETGIVIRSAGTVIEGNFIGIDSSGMTLRVNGNGGIYLAPLTAIGSFAGETIGGTTAAARNVVCGSGTFDGNQITLDGADGISALVQGNYIGLGRDGVTSFFGYAQGVVIYSSGNIIGTPDGPNIIAGNFNGNVRIQDANNNIVQSNRIGGSLYYNHGPGIFIAGGSQNRIGGNAALGEGNEISGNDNGGIRIEFSGETTIQGNLITQNGSSQAAGIFVAVSSQTLIGGGFIGAGNIIAGNGEDGITITANSDDTTIVGNYIGIESDGVSILSNGRTAISLLSGSNIVGGPNATDRNIIASNGIGVYAGSSQPSLIQGNYVGVGTDGLTPLDNGGVGIYIAGPSGNTVLENVISGRSQGIVIESNSNTISGNLIGTAADGTTPRPNQGDGILITGTASDNEIGGIFPFDANIIAFNGGSGISLFGGERNFIMGNSFHNNGGLGIDLGGDGATPNDIGDADAGPNNLQNAPLLTGIHYNPNATLDVEIAATCNTQYRINIYASEEVDPSGNGEGTHYLMTTSKSTDAQGSATLSIPLPNLPQGARYFSATATDPLGNTSEFSNTISLSALGRSWTLYR